MPDKPKVAFYWCASCGGCEEAVVDLAEDILDVVAAVDIVFWPVALDFKYKRRRGDARRVHRCHLAQRRHPHHRAGGDGPPAAPQEPVPDRLRLLRPSAAAFPAWPTSSPREQILQLRLRGSAHHRSTKPKTRPQTAVQGQRPRRCTLPELHNVVRALDQVVEVDYYLPGCPPTPKLTKAAVAALLEGKLPPKGTRAGARHRAVRASARARTPSPTNLSFTAFKRPHQVLIDPEQVPAGAGRGLHGPGHARRLRGRCASAATCPAPAASAPPPACATRAQRSCPRSAPTSPPRRKRRSTTVLAGIPDPVGTFYRYGLAKSLLRRKVSLPAAMEGTL